MRRKKLERPEEARWYRDLFKLSQERLSLEMGLRHAVQRGAALPFSLEEARRAVVLCLAAEQAIEAGAPIKVRA